MPVRIWIVACIVAAAGCTKQNPAFCDDETAFCESGACDLATNTCTGACRSSSECGSPSEPICDDSECRGCQDSAECAARDLSAAVCDAQTGECGGCSEDIDCPDSAPVCETETGACTPCAENADCEGRAGPFCDDGGFCRGCVDHDECDGGVCLDDGSCPLVGEIIHVQAGSAQGAPCGVGADTPCGEIQGAILTMATSPARVVLVESGTYNARINVDGGALGTDRIFIRARPGAHLAPIVIAGSSVTIQVHDGADVTVDGLEVTGPAFDEIGVQCTTAASVRLRSLPAVETYGIGIRGAPGCALVELVRSRLRGNRVHAIQIEQCAFDIRNNIVAENNDPAFFSSTVVIDAPDSGTRVFSFNTVTMNNAGNVPGIVGGVMCDGEDLVLDSNVIHGNSAGGSALDDQIGGSCTHVYSAIQGIAAANGNTPADPMLEAGTFRLMSGSPCIDAADPDATEPVDVEGSIRPVGPSRDIGADEFGN